jgi:hypothetical protein
MTIGFQMRRFPTRHDSPPLSIAHYMWRQCGSLDVSQPYGPPRPVTRAAVRFTSSEYWVAISVPSQFEHSHVSTAFVRQETEEQLEGEMSEDRIPRNVNWKRNLKISHRGPIQLTLNEEDTSGVIGVYTGGMSYYNLVETPAIPRHK